MNQPQPLLEVHDLVKYFDVSEGLFKRSRQVLKAVDGISFTLNKGETLGLVGESGCGKSTLGRVLLKLIEPTSGRIYFDGASLHDKNEKQLRPFRKDIQIIFQDPYASLNPRFTIAEILAEPLEIHGLIKDKNERIDYIRQIMSEVGLDPKFINRYPHEFSGGQRQRIGIARALCLKPKLIICDEPVSALDVSIQSQILNLLMDLRDKYNLSLIFIAHDLAVIEHISTKVAVMYLGKIVEYASCEKLFSSPSHPYTKILLSSIPKVEISQKKEFTTIEGDVPSAINPPSGCAFHTRCPYAKEICKQTQPKFLNLVNDQEHFVSCHFAH